MSDLLNFLNEMEEKASKLSSGSIGTVGEVIVEFGFHRWIPDKDFWTAFVASKSKEDMNEARSESAEILLANGINDAPNFGIRITVKADVLNREQPYKQDRMEFTPAWAKDDYDLFLSSLSAAEEANPGSVKIGEPFYAQIKKEYKPYKKAQGEAGKTDTNMEGQPDWPRMDVVRAAFKNKKEAEKFIADNNQEEPFVSLAEKEAAESNGFPYDELSKKGQKTYKPTEDWETLGQALHDEINELMKSGELGYKAVYALAAESAGLEVADIKLFKLDLPF